MLNKKAIDCVTQFIAFSIFKEQILNQDFAGLFSSLFGAVSVVPFFSGQVHFSEAAKLTYMVVSVACPFE